MCEFRGFKQTNQNCVVIHCGLRCRRPSEVAYAKIENYSTLTSRGNLSVFTVLATKKNVRVPVIVPRAAHLAIEAILKNRYHCGSSWKLNIFKERRFRLCCKHFAERSKCKIPIWNSPDSSLQMGYAITGPLCHSTIQKRHMPKQLGHSTAKNDKFYEMPNAEVLLNVIGTYLNNNSGWGQWNWTSESKL